MREEKAGKSGLLRLNKIVKNQTNKRCKTIFVALKMKQAERVCKQKSNQKCAKKGSPRGIG